MEFDKSKVLTPITVNQFKGEQLGWGADKLMWLEDSVRGEKPQLVTLDKSAIDYPFKIGDSSWRYFYPAPEPTYHPFNNDELNDLVGKVLTSKFAGDNRLVTERVNYFLVRVGGALHTAEELLDIFTLDGKPCGAKE